MSNISKKWLLAAAALVFVATACQGQQYDNQRRRSMDGERRRGDCGPAPCVPDVPARPYQQPQSRCKDRPCGPDQGSSMGSNEEILNQEENSDTNTSVEAEAPAQAATESPAVAEAVTEESAVQVESATAASSVVTETVTAP